MSMNEAKDRTPHDIVGTEEQRPRKPSKPPWIRVRLPAGEAHERVKALMRGKSLHTVCEEARCPNMAECWSAGTATFLILGKVCTRNCAFCAVSSGMTLPPSPREPLEVARAVRSMGLHHVVITSVTRDDLSDGGASVFARVMKAIRREVPSCSVEVLIPDFLGNLEALETVLSAGPDILGHNVETVPRLYGKVRPQAVYERSLELLGRARSWRSWERSAGNKDGEGSIIKSGIMVGLGETREEVLQVMDDLIHAGCGILTIGQYLSPGGMNLPVERFYHPEEFEELRVLGLAKGFRWVQSSPLTRSSYHAEKQIIGAFREKICHS